ncbi:MAG: 4Fe-4S dicluster domain-containing protein, partial [Quinella sp. 1Q7]|nr:4Fe-4S dicluster domain-containing protein [Quinella sp. 1Q7]
DWENPAIQSRGCYEVARRHGKPIVIMEPIKGGTLANPPEVVANVFKAANPDASLASWAIRFAASLDGIITVLSGMSTLDQMQDNVSYMENFKRLDDSEQATVVEARKVLASLPIIPCTDCRYCLSQCPQNVGINGSFTAYNVLTLYKNKAFADGQYNWLVERHGKEYASKCIKCGRCERVCPQHIPIRANLAKVAEAFGR